MIFIFNKKNMLMSYIIRGKYVGGAAEVHVSVRESAWMMGMRGEQSMNFYIWMRG